MIYDSVARSIDSALNSPEIIHETSDEIEIRKIRASFDAASKSPEIVHEVSRLTYSRESLLLRSESDICKKLPADIDESNFRDLRNSYARDGLISVAEVNVYKKLPTGFDQPTFRRLQDEYESPPQIHEHQNHESGSAGGFQGASNREYRERWHSFKQNTVDRACKSAPEIQNLQGRESLPVGRMSGAPSENSVERWDRFKLMKAESESTVSQKYNWHQLQRPWLNPTTTGSLRNASPTTEQSGILGSGAGPKSSVDGSEMSTLKLPVSDNGLNKCSQPYRPPSFFKAMSHAKTQKHELHSNKASEHAEGPIKETGTEESLRKASFDINTKEPLQETEQKSNGHDEEVNLKLGGCTALEEHSALQETEEQKPSERNEEDIPKSSAWKPLEEHSALHILDRFKVSPPIVPSVSESAEAPFSPCETSEKCLTVTQDSLEDHELVQEQEISYVEKLPPQIKEGGRFSALICLEDAEDIDPDLIDEAISTCNANPKDAQKIIEGNVGFSKTKKKGLTTLVAPPAKSTFPNNTVEKTDIQSSAVKASMTSEAFIKPSFKKHQKGPNNASKNSQKGFAKKTSNADDSTTKAKVSDGSLSELWLTSHSTKHQDVMVDCKESCKPDANTGYWFSDNDNASSNFSLWPDLSQNNIWRTSSGTFTKQNLLDKGQPRETSVSGHEFPVKKVAKTANSKFDILPLVERKDFEEVDSNFEINLPDEDSLVTVDDTYMFQEDVLNNFPDVHSKGGKTNSAFSDLNKPIQTSNLYQSYTYPGPWFVNAPLNLAKMFVNRSTTRPDPIAPQFRNPWGFNHQNSVLFPDGTFSFGQIPMTPQIYEPSLQNFPSPRETVPQVHGFHPHLNKSFPNEAYDQVQQIPWCPKKANLLDSHPRNYHRNVIPTCVGMKENIRPTFSQILQMQIEMATMTLNSVPS